jgi:hypothetical protein
MTQEQEMILRFPKEIKIRCLQDALEQDKFVIFMGLSKILLDAPINESGLETEIIEMIHNDYLNKNGVKPI